MEKKRLEKVYLFVKRACDIAFGMFGCFFTMFAAAFVKISYLVSGDREKIIYSQVRVGKDGKLFRIYKFRTMIPEADHVLESLLKDKENKDEWEKTQKLENDPRITSVGAVLRRNSIDEMPQFYNVLKGEMSVIGPRPLIPGELESHGGLPLYNTVKPGITGWWACHGRINGDYKERLDLEYHYIKNRGFIMDAVCFIKTVFVVSQGR